MIEPGTENDIEQLDQEIISYNLQQVPFPDNPPWKTLSFVHKEKDEMLAGVYGFLFMNNVLKINVLYVNEAMRKKGYGTRLLRHLEAEAKKQTAYLSILDTYDFQALEFYLKNGYEIFARLNDCPAPGHTRYSLMKKL